MAQEFCHKRTTSAASTAAPEGPEVGGTGLGPPRGRPWPWLVGWGLGMPPGLVFGKGWVLSWFVGWGEWLISESLETWLFFGWKKGDYDYGPWHEIHGIGGCDKHHHFRHQQPSLLFTFGAWQVEDLEDDDTETEDAWRENFKVYHWLWNPWSTRSQTEQCLISLINV